MDDSKYEFDYLDFQRRGYFGATSVPPDAPPPRNWKRTPWYGWAFAFARAKKGDFGALPHLLPLLEEDLGGTFEQAACILLGDAGPSDIFASLKETLKRHEGYDLSFYAAEAIASRGKLGDVPLLVAFHRATHNLPDIPSVPEMLSDILHPEGLLPLPDEFESVDDYCRMVERRWKELAERFGTTDVCLWLGEPTSTRRMAKSIVAKAREPYFPFSYRRKFEASTGIDCSAFYKADRSFQPLSASAIAEDFLASPRSAPFLDGTRYFFGNPLSD
ncbi:hypothetical protein MYSTI_02745 [Myxococcus stipitatus DSM 14675]|uniref:Uncharacterized protein n=1 Tax=Myxococcus stipitatus (strain DSM 14675 / JCM 12634 / Mx s8) TaxID=1278073 RepID=L7U5C9_MYXSD|nr:hypothetical protein [Myxococcus stipitatus]AGC44061.1 hypothetical protein MYSTI_02745 [Myxococcus stipitatus DSM 14675]